MMEFWHDPGCGFHPASAMDYLPAAQLRQLLVDEDIAGYDAGDGRGGQAGR